MPRRRPRNLDAFRFELGTFERDLLRDHNMIQGIKALSLPLGAGLLGMGIALGGFLAYNKVDDLKEWVADNWEDGFGLVNDPAQTQEQVSQASTSTRVSNPDLKGMSNFTIYQIHYDKRAELMQFFTRLWCEYEGKEWNGENSEFFQNFYWGLGALGSPIQNEPTYRFERDNVIKIAGEDKNDISEYVYQMIIRETDSRNTTARYASGLVGALSTGVGLAASEAVHWALRTSGFMDGGNEWDGQNWEEAPGANRDPLLMFAWARTDFQTGKWWSTVDSQGDIAFWASVGTGGMGGALIPTKGSKLPYVRTPGGEYSSYEDIIWNAHLEMSDNEYGPYLQYLAESIPTGGWWVYDAMTAKPPLPDPEEQSESEYKEDPSNQEWQGDQGDDQMPGEEPDPRNDPTKEEYWRARGEQPPPGWVPS